GLALAPGLAWQSEARCYALTCLGASWVNPEGNASPILNRPEAHVQNDRWAFRSPHRPTIVTTESIRRRTVEESDHRNRLLRPRRQRARAVAPPSSVMNSRRFTRSPRRRAEGTVPGS